MLTLSRSLLSASLLLAGMAQADEDTAPVGDQMALMSTAKKSAATGKARKTREVDARPAMPGEIVITFIRGEGAEMLSRPAEEGDWVVRNRCEATGNEERLVKASNFVETYGEPISESTIPGYSSFKPVAEDLDYIIVPEGLGPLRLKASTGEAFTALPGDAIVQMSKDERSAYPVAQPSFECSYEIVVPAKTIMPAQ